MADHKDAGMVLFILCLILFAIGFYNIFWGNPNLILPLMIPALILFFVSTVMLEWGKSLHLVITTIVLEEEDSDKCDCSL